MKPWVYYILFLSCCTATFADEDDGSTIQQCIRRGYTSKTKLSTNIMLNNDHIIYNTRRPGLKSKGSDNGNGGKLYFYRIENMPECSEISEDEIRKQINLAAEEWNKVEKANILLVNVDNADYNASGSTKVISVSFERCNHSKDSNSKRSYDPNFDPCDGVYAHTAKGRAGFIHFNTWVTWSNEVHPTDQSGYLAKADLYSIALHEFGYSLGLSNSYDRNDAMFWGFSLYKKLEISENDKANLIRKHKVMKSCRDNQPSYCSLDACGTKKEKACKKLCGLCDDCTDPVRDDYLKCNQDICDDKDHEMRQYCTKTCELC